MGGHRGEGGFTLAEVLVSVAILGISFAVIVGGIGTAVMTSDIDRKQATAQNGLRTYAEAVRADAYDPCPGVPDYGTSYSPPSGFSKSISIEYWVRAKDDFEPTCPLNDDGLQRATLTIASADGRASETVVVLKRAG